MKNELLLATLMILALSLLGWNSYGQKARTSEVATRRTVIWEYKLAQVDSEEKFNALGAQGWELVGFEGVEQGSPFRNCVFKRAK